MTKKQIKKKLEKMLDINAVIYNELWDRYSNKRKLSYKDVEEAFEKLDKIEEILKYQVLYYF